MKVISPLDDPVHFPRLGSVDRSSSPPPISVFSLFRLITLLPSLPPLFFHLFSRRSIPSNPKMLLLPWISFIVPWLLSFFVVSALPKPSPELVAPVRIPFCPVYSRVIRRPDGEPRKCLPHQLNLCLNALDDRSLIDARGVCCYHNQVDYFCCMDIPARLCPSYRNVTVVIHNNFPQSPFPVRSFHFRKGVVEDIEGFSSSKIVTKN